MAFASSAFPYGQNNAAVYMSYIVDIVDTNAEPLSDIRRPESALQRQPHVTYTSSIVMPQTPYPCSHQSSLVKHGARRYISHHRRKALRRIHRIWSHPETNRSYPKSKPKKYQREVQTSTTVRIIRHHIVCAAVCC